jgi:CubicO group peptidase (beta-lactamase class C family)
MSEKNDFNPAALLGYLDNLASKDAFSGSVLVAKNGIPIFSHACGLASKSFTVPNRIDTKFNLGSMNKVFTGLAVCQLAQRDRLDFIEEHLLLKL